MRTSLKQFLKTVNFNFILVYYKGDYDLICLLDQLIAFCLYQRNSIFITKLELSDINTHPAPYLHVYDNDNDNSLLNINVVIK